MRNSEILLDIKSPTCVHIWGRMAGKTINCIEILEQDSDALCLVPTLNMMQNYPPHLRHRIFTSHNLKKAMGMRGRRLIIDNIDLMSHVSDRVWIELYNYFDITDVFKSPSSFVDWLILYGNVDTRVNERYEAESGRVKRFPWF